MKLHVSFLVASIPFLSLGTALVGEETTPSSHTMTITQSHWECPRFSVEPFHYYRITFRSKTAAHGYWFVRFFDGTGAEINADQYSSIQPSQEWISNDSCFMARAEARTALYGFRQDKGDLTVEDAAVTAIRPSDALRWIDDLYHQLPPVHVRPEAGRFHHLPRTLTALQSGRQLRVLMLGDSIANDSANSLFQLLIGRIYPASRMTLIHSVKGATGCQFYQKDEELNRYVLRHKPDLVIIAGISHHNDADAILNVIRKTRLALPDVEFLVVNDAVHDAGLTVDPARKQIAPPSTEDRRKEADFCRKIMEARDTERFAFLNMWNERKNYFSSCGQPLESYYRDNIHYNDRGKQIIGRILASFFEPEGQE